MIENLTNLASGLQNPLYILDYNPKYKQPKHTLCVDNFKYKIINIFLLNVCSEFRKSGFHKIQK